MRNSVPAPATGCTAAAAWAPPYACAAGCWYAPGPPGVGTGWRACAPPYAACAAAGCIAGVGGAGRRGACIGAAPPPAGIDGGCVVGAARRGGVVTGVGP